MNTHRSKRKYSKGQSSRVACAEFDVVISREGGVGKQRRIFVEMIRQALLFVFCQTFQSKQMTIPAPTRLGNIHLKNKYLKNIFFFFFLFLLFL
jgi:hypothetical protein